jgi:hypothetical protein
MGGTPVPSSPVEGIAMTRPIVLSLRPISGRRVILRIERLDERTLPSATIAEPVFPMVMAGSSKLAPSDSPDQRIDPNDADSPFGGVGSLVVTTKKATYLGTATAIDSRHILTAAHVVDLNNDGKFDAKDGTTGVYFILNYGGDATAKIAVTQFDIDPNFTGFNRPSVNDDIAVLTLAEDLPVGVPTYPMVTSDLTAGTVITIVGYGSSGTGNTGNTTAGSPVVKRVGENVVDAFYGQDDKGQAERNEVFRFDFDGPTGNGPLGGGTLGNNVETQLAPGDSGGPSFVVGPAGYEIAGVNTYVQGSNAPKFGSMGGGMDVYAYLGFIRPLMTPVSTDPATDAIDAPVARPIDWIPIMGPLSRPAKGGAGVGIGAKPVSGELLDGLAGSTASNLLLAGPARVPNPLPANASNGSDVAGSSFAFANLVGSVIDRNETPEQFSASISGYLSLDIDAGLLNLVSGDGMSIDVQ